MTQPSIHAFHPDPNTSPGEGTPELIAAWKDTPEGWFASPDPIHLPPYDPVFTYNVNFYRAYIGAFYSELGQAEESSEHWRVEYNRVAGILEEQGQLETNEREALGAVGTLRGVEGAGRTRDEGGGEIAGGGVHESTRAAGGDGGREAPRRGVFQDLSPGQGIPPINREGGGSGLKARKPDNYDGNRAGLEVFLCSLKNYLAMYPGSSEVQQVNVALSYMTTGVGGKWATRQAMTVGMTGGIQNMKEFEDKIREAFDDPERAVTARNQLQTILQAKRPVETYLVDFEMLEFDPQLEDISLVELFKNGLDNHVWAACHNDRPLPTTLAKWKEAASIHDRALRRKDEEMAE